MKKLYFAHFITLVIYWLSAIVAIIGIRTDSVVIAHISLFGAGVICLIFRIYFTVKHIPEIEPKNSFQNRTIRVWKLSPTVDIAFILFHIIILCQ